MRESMLFYRSFYEAVKVLDAESFKKTVCALLDYGLDEIVPVMSGVEGAIFIMARPQIDANNIRYQNAKKGGRKPKANQVETKPKPKANQTETKPKPKANQTETKPKPNVNVNDNVNVNANVNANVTSSEADASAPSQTTVASFTLNDKTRYEVTAEELEYYKRLYPAVDVEQELRKIEGWCDANPKNRKTRAGARKFLNSWLARTQDSGGSRRGRESNVQASGGTDGIKVNAFHNFEEREYDFGALDRAFDKKFQDEWAR